MRVFCHISDNTEGAWRSFPMLFLMSKPLAIWAPSGAEIKIAWEEHHSLISPAALIDLAEAGEIEIHARERWYDPMARKSGRWTLPHEWSEEFDGRLAKAFAKMGSGFQGLFAHPDGVGDEWADRQLQQNSDSYVAALKMVRDKSVMPSTLIRAKQLGLTSSAEIAKLVLRDAKNHIDAFAGAKANIDLEPDDFWWTRPLLCQEEFDPGSRPSARTAPIQYRNYRELSKIINEISRPKTLQDLITVKKDLGENLRKQIWEMYEAEASPSLIEEIRLEDLVQQRSLIQYLFGDGITDRVANAASVAGLVAGVCDALTQVSAAAVVGMAAGLYPPLKSFILDKGIIPMREFRPGDPLTNALERSRVFPFIPYYRGVRANLGREIAERIRNQRAH